MNNDTLKREDINLFGSAVVSKPVKVKKIKAYGARAGEGGKWLSRFHSRKVAMRAVRLLKAWGRDAYLLPA